jgi:hypothetical protein
MLLVIGATKQKCARLDLIYAFTRIACIAQKVGIRYLILWTRREKSQIPNCALFSH